MAVAQFKIRLKLMDFIMNTIIGTLNIIMRTQSFSYDKRGIISLPIGGSSLMILGMTFSLIAHNVAEIIISCGPLLIITPRRHNIIQETIKLCSMKTVK